jgi:DHA1 family bicyclomycin/chloramphenicol resistance-like MFS transporter
LFLYGSGGRPSDGNILDYYNWYGIFFMFKFISMLLALWFWRRQPETLSAEKKKFLPERDL